MLDEYQTGIRWSIIGKGYSFVRMAIATIAVACSPLIITPAMAEATSSARDAAFARMYRAPTDRAAMLDYARLSIEARDYEAVAAVLERLVFLEPSNIDAREQLAIAYFALGSDAMAKRQIALVIAADPLRGPTLSAYAKAAERRLSPLRESVSVWLGGLGSSDPRGVFFEAGGTLNIRQALGGGRGSEWLTRLALSAKLPQNNTTGENGYLAELRTGPSLRLGGAASGPQAHVYARFLASRDTDSTQDISAGLGLQSQVSTGRHTLSGDFSFGSLDKGQGDSGIFRRGDIAFTWRPADTAFVRPRLSVVAQDGGAVTTELRHTIGVDLGKEVDVAILGSRSAVRLSMSLANEELTRPAQPDSDRLLASGAIRFGLSNEGWFELAGGTARNNQPPAGVVERPEWISFRIGKEF